MVMQVDHIQKQGGIKGLLQRLMSTSDTSAYVGVPQQTSSRPNQEINNASLLYIHTHGIRRRSMINAMQKTMNQGKKYSDAFKLYVMEHGSPLWQSPPRPVIEPALRDGKARVNAAMLRRFKAAAKGDSEAEKQALIRLGMVGQNIARAWFTNPKNGWPPNSPLTIRRKGSARPLIDKGELRKSIIFVVR